MSDYVKQQADGSILLRPGIEEIEIWRWSSGPAPKIIAFRIGPTGDITPELQAMHDEAEDFRDTAVQKAAEAEVSRVAADTAKDDTLAARSDTLAAAAAAEVSNQASQSAATESQSYRDQSQTHAFASEAARDLSSGHADTATLKAAEAGASADQAAQRVVDAQVKVDLAADHALTATNASVLATDKAAVATAAASNAATSETQADAHRAAAAGSADLAELWASADEDVEIAPGLYSAKHYMLKTMEYAEDILVPATVLSAITQVDGVNSGLDADLLDGQHGSYYTNIIARLGYTPLNAATYTASDVLAKLLTVDGAGTGLDADLLDGQHGSYYTNIIARLGYTPLSTTGGTLTGFLTIESANGHGLRVQTTDPAVTPYMSIWRGGVQKLVIQSSAATNTADIIAPNEALRLYSGGVQSLTVNTSGVVDLHKVPCLHVIRSAGASYSVGSVVWGAETMRQECTWDGSLFFATRAGRYVFTASLLAVLPGSLSSVSFVIQKNGSDASSYATTPVSSTALGYCPLTVETTLVLAVGDYVSVRMISISSGAGLAAGPYSSFSAQKIG